MIDMNELIQEVVKQCVEIIHDEINMKIPKIIDSVIEEADKNTKKQVSIVTQDFNDMIRKIAKEELNNIYGTQKFKNMITKTIKEELNNINYQSNSYSDNKVTSKEVEKLKNQYGSMTADGWVLYMNRDEGERLYKIRLDGSENTQLTTGKIWSINNIENGWVYYYDVHMKEKKVRLE